MNESFVVEALKAHFGRAGFEVWPKERAGYVDLICEHLSDGLRWVIEAKGKTKNIGDIRTDFCTGLGQILTRMDNERALYALAVPDIPAFINQCRNVPGRVRRALGLHWIVVDEYGVLVFFDPDHEP